MFYENVDRYKKTDVMMCIERGKFPSRLQLISGNYSMKIYDMDVIVHKWRNSRPRTMLILFSFVPRNEPIWIIENNKFTLNSPDNNRLNNLNEFSPVYLMVDYYSVLARTVGETGYDTTSLRIDFNFNTRFGFSLQDIEQFTDPIPINLHLENFFKHCKNLKGK